jgi:uncharacterized protein YndB with AHSA1/START domain
MTAIANNRAPRALTDGDLILASADINATPEQLFQALTSKDIETWWGAPDTYLIRDWQGDLQVGGRYSLNVIKPESPPLPTSGVYLKVEAPHVLSLTQRYEFDFPPLGWRDTIITYLLRPTATGTRLVVRHEGFGPATDAAEYHKMGWERTLSYLQAHFAASVAERLAA